MNCRWEDVPDSSVGDARRVRCVVCGLVLHPTPHPHDRIFSDCRGDKRPGPGTVLRRIIREIGIKETASCGCEAMQHQMNAWHADGCEAHRAEIIAHLQSAYDSASLATKAKALGAALWNGYPLTLGGLLDEAIERSQKTTAKQP